MSDRAANSSDLALARMLSERLSGPHRPRRSLADSESAPFARFSHEAVAPGTPEPAFDPAHATPRDFGSWSDLLAWTKEVTPCHVGFVVDPEGFVIAQYGDRSLEKLEGIGAQFQEVADRATEIEAGAARSLALQLDPFWLSGLRFSREGSGYFLVGIIADEPLSKEVQAAISSQVEHNLEWL